MFITAVCVLFLIKLRWPKNKSIYATNLTFVNIPYSFDQPCSQGLTSLPPLSLRSISCFKEGKKRDPGNELVIFSTVDMDSDRDRKDCVKGGAYYCYCAYVLRISRYSDFLSVMLTNTRIFLRGLKLSRESRS